MSHATDNSQPGRLTRRALSPQAPARPVTAPPVDPHVRLARTRRQDRHTVAAGLECGRARVTGRPPAAPARQAAPMCKRQSRIPRADASPIPPATITTGGFTPCTHRTVPRCYSQRPATTTALMRLHAESHSATRPARVRPSNGATPRARAAPTLRHPPAALATRRVSPGCPRAPQPRLSHAAHPPRLLDRLGSRDCDPCALPS